VINRSTDDPACKTVIPLRSKLTDFFVNKPPLPSPNHNSFLPAFLYLKLMIIKYIVQKINFSHIIYILTFIYIYKLYRYKYYLIWKLFVFYIFCPASILMNETRLYCDFLYYTCSWGKTPVVRRPSLKCQRAKTRWNRIRVILRGDVCK